MNLKELHFLIENIEKSKKCIPKGKILITGNQEVICLMEKDFWQGEYYFSNLLREDQVYLLDENINYQYKPIIK